MGYSKKFSPERYEPIAKVLEAIQALEPGKSFILSVDPGRPEELGLIKYLVYDFLFHTGLKKNFRIKTLENELLILRLGLRAEPKFVLQKNNQELIETLIELWDTEAAKVRLKEWVDSGKISAEDGDELWKSVQKIMA
jgi:hypothetical protein